MSSLALVVALATSTATVATSTTTTATTTSEKVEAVDAFRYAKYAALVDGVWSAAITAAWAFSARSYDLPYPEGPLGITFARVLYGTTWTIIVAANTAVLRWVTGESFEGISKGALRNHWYINLDIPAPCERGGGGFCGVGLGGYSEISVTLDEHFELAMTGGWVQGRFDTDDRRTLMESTWVQSPIMFRTRLEHRLGPARFETVLGAGLYHGMHNAHVHEGPAFRGELEVPPYELIVLHAGAGAGAHVKLGIDLFDVVTIDAELDLAPFYFSVSPDPPPVVAPLDHRPSGTIVWRRATVGIGLAKGILPVRLGVRAYGLELGPGPVYEAGHKGFIIHFDTPFDLEEDEEEED